MERMEPPEKPKIDVPDHAPKVGRPYSNRACVCLCVLCLFVCVFACPAATCP